MGKKLRDKKQHMHTCSTKALVEHIHRRDTHQVLSVCS